MNINKIPSIEIIRNAIKRVNSEVFPKYNIDIDVYEYVETILNLLTKEFGLIPNLKQQIKSKNFLQEFYRARELDTFTDLELIREYSYPPLDRVSMGRCNFPSKPVFYCSNNAKIALLEVGKHNIGKGKEICLSKWELVKTEGDIIVESFLHSDLPETNAFGSIGKGLQQNINKPFKISYKKNLTKKQEMGLVEYLKFLSKAFLDDDSYSLSAALAHGALYANHNYRSDILIYPSIQSNLLGVNIAMNPNFADNFLKMTRAYIVQIEKHDPNACTIDILFKSCAIVKNSVINWELFNPNIPEHEQMIIQDFGVLRDIQQKK